MLPDGKAEINLLAMVISSSWDTREGFIKVSGKHSLIEINVNWNLPLAVAGGYKASLDMAGIIHSVFSRLQEWFRKFLLYVFH